MTEIIKKMWNERSDKYYQTNTLWNDAEQLTKLIAEPAWAFPKTVMNMLRAAFPTFSGLRVLVPSSGDNMAAFAFHLMGAKVTSCDISERQLENAGRIARERGWDIDFVCADSMRLCGVSEGEYDLVYTSNGVHVWICDLPAMYAGFCRALKPGGRYIMFETHPFIRPFDDTGAEIKVIKPYGDTKPRHGELTHTWRIQDFFNAMAGAGFAIERMEEFHPEIGSYDSWWYKNPAEALADGNAKFDWRQNPWAALPQWIGFSARRAEII